MKIVVEPAFLIQSANQMEEQIQAYERQYRKMYQEVETMQNSWQGKDNLAYVTQINGFQKDFQQMVILLTQYVQFLKSSAKMYQDTQEERMLQARKLAG